MTTKKNAAQNVKNNGEVPAAEYAEDNAAVATKEHPVENASKPEAREEHMRKVVSRTNKSTREYTEEFPVDRIIFDPADNYRWGSEEDMINDTEKGEGGKSYSTLVASARTFGIEEPVGLYPTGKDGKMRIIFGFTRVKAAQDVGIKTIPAYVYPSDISKGEALLLQGRENSAALKREVNWTKEAEYIVRLAEECGGMDAKAWAKVCKVLGKAKGTLSRMLRAYENIPESVRKEARKGRLSVQAAELFKASADEGGERYTNKDAQTILDEAGQIRDNEGNVTGERETVTPQRLKAAMETLEKEGDVKPTAKGQSKTAKPTTGQLRDDIALLLNRVLHEDGIGAMTEEELDAAVDSAEAYMASGIAIAVGDVASPSAEGADEDVTFEQGSTFRERALMQADADLLLSQTENHGVNKKGDSVAWIDGESKDEDGSRVSNKKRMEALIDEWAEKDAVEVEVKKGKIESVDATPALRLMGFHAEFDEMVAEDFNG